MIWKKPVLSTPMLCWNHPSKQVETQEALLSLTGSISTIKSNRLNVFQVLRLILLQWRVSFVTAIANAWIGNSGLRASGTGCTVAGCRRSGITLDKLLRGDVEGGVLTSTTSSWPRRCRACGDLVAGVVLGPSPI